MNLQFTPRLDILPDPQKELWPELVDVPSEFVLYGGTALALQLGHRESVDFDFFGSADFDPEQLLRDIPFLSEGKTVQSSPSTLTVIVERTGAIQVSFFGLPELARIEAPLIVKETNLQVATMLDLSGTKAAAVQRRAEAKDYIDLDVIFQNSDVDLSKALSAASLIYGSQFNPELTLKALSFFGDGNLDTVPAETRLRLVDVVKGVDLEKLPDVSSSKQNPQSENGT